MILENLVAIVGDKQKGFAKMRMARLIWKKSCAAVLCGTMLCAMLPSAGFANDGDVSYEYYEDGIWKTGVQNAGEYAVIDSVMDCIEWESGWYVV